MQIYLISNRIIFRYMYSFGTELLRKMIHLNAVYIILLYEFLGKDIILSILTIMLTITLGIEYLRICHNKKILFFHKTLRDKEKDTMGGHIYFIMSAIIVISVFSKEIAMLSIIMATFGDAAAAIFGRAYGKNYIKGLKNKATEGVMAEFIADITLGLLYLILFSSGSITIAWLIILIIMSAVATIVETVSMKMDDNLLVPIFSGITGEALVIIIPLIYSII